MGSGLLRDGCTKVVRKWFVRAAVCSCCSPQMWPRVLWVCPAVLPCLLVRGLGPRLCNLRTCGVLPCFNLRAAPAYCGACCMVKNPGLAYVSCVLHGQKSRLGPWLGVFWLWCLTGFVCVSWVLHGQKSRLGPWWGVFWLWCLTGFACVSWVLRGQTSQRRFQMSVSRPHIFVRCIWVLFCFWLHLVLSTHLVQMHLVRCFVSRCIWLCQQCGFANTDFVVLSIACLCVVCVAARFANAEFVVLSIACLWVMRVGARFVVFCVLNISWS